MFAVIGSLAGEGSPLTGSPIIASITHKAISRRSHSPNDGAWWSHMFWLAYSTHNGQREAISNAGFPTWRPARGCV
ncbi:MAG: hypothetical protein R3C05_30360 [Pirellulaceae bacterium]